MGISASATLAYGIDLEDSQPWNQHDDNYEPMRPELEDEDFDGLGEYLAFMAGYENPYNSIPEGYSYSKRDDFPEFRDAVDEYLELTSRLEREAPVKIEYYGFPQYDYNAYALIINSEECIREDFGKLDVGKAGLPREPTATELLNAIKFCEEHKFGDFSKATWLMVTNVG